jgi:hypothetical protein
VAPPSYEADVAKIHIIPLPEKPVEGQIKAKFGSADEAIARREQIAFVISGPRDLSCFCQWN